MRAEESLPPTWPDCGWSALACPDGTHVLVEQAALDVDPSIRITEQVGRAQEPIGLPPNLVLVGDSLYALTAIKSGRPRRGYAGKVKLAYLDPPFNTHEKFDDFHDSLDRKVWLTMMRDRLHLVADLLAPDGSVWVHCDDREQAYLRLLMDSVYGPDAFIATIVWQRRYSRDNRRAIGPVHDYIHVYSPLGQRWKNIRNRLSRKDDPNDWKNLDDDPRGPWATTSLVAQAGHATPAQFYDIRTPSGRVVEPPAGSCWRVTKKRFSELVAERRIWFGQAGGNVPRKKVYLSEAQGLVPWTWWPHQEVGHNEEAKREIRRFAPNVAPFATPKPERLIARIIQIATEPGDLVLDCFAGSGTTGAVAHKLSRRWIAVELSEETVSTFLLPRLRAVVGGLDRGGVTESVGWSGGGGFHVGEVSPALASVRTRRRAAAAL